MQNQQNSTVNMQYVSVKQIIPYNHNGAYYLVARTDDNKYLDITKTDARVLSAIRGIYAGNTFYHFSEEQCKELARVADAQTVSQ